jgi:hypothetical protein
MPEEIQPGPSIPVPEPKKKSRFKAPAILIASSAASMLIGCGLCGVGGFNLEGDNKYPIVVGIGTLAFWGGLLALGVGIIWFLVAIVATASDSRPQGKPQ